MVGSESGQSPVCLTAADLRLKYLPLSSSSRKTSPLLSVMFAVRVQGWASQILSVLCNHTGPEEGGYRRRLLLPRACGLGLQYPDNSNLADDD